jgi:CRISPR-associated endonuclease Csn1
MNKIIGIDTGTSYTGLSLIEQNDNEITKILDVKVIQSSFENESKYNTSDFKTPTTVRRLKRSARKNRKHKHTKLYNIKKELLNYFNLSIKKDYINIIDLKIKGLSEKLNLDELLAVIYNYAKYNGYNEIDDDIIDGETKSEYKKKICNITDWCDKNNLTISSYYKMLSDESKKYRHSDYPIHNSLHKKEVKLLLNNQKNYYPELITDDFIKNIIKKIYFRRGLKSSRHLISDCPYEKYKKVCPKSHPLAQEYLIWEVLHNLRLTTINNIEIEITNEEKKYLFSVLNTTNEELSNIEIIDKIIDYRKRNYVLKYDILYNIEDIEHSQLINLETQQIYTLSDYEINFLKNIVKIEGISFNSIKNELYDPTLFKLSHKKINGNKTKIKIIKIINDNLKILKENSVNKINDKEFYKIVDNIIEDFWLKIYSETNKNNIIKSFNKYNENSNKYFELSSEQIEQLSLLNLSDDFIDCSSRALKKILPYMNGEKDFKNHYDVINTIYKQKTIENNNELCNIKMNSLRNPIVEKQINNIINQLNYWKHNNMIDNNTSVNIELSRDLMLPKKIRIKIEKNNYKNNKNNKFIEDIIIYYKKRNSASSIKRIKLWFEQGGEIDKNFKIIKNAADIYCDDEITIDDALNTLLYNIEHSVPESRYFGNNMLNLSLTKKEINSKKNNKTSYEFIKENYSIVEQEKIWKKIDNLYLKNNPNKIKWFKYGYENFPENMSNNQLVNNSYISKELVKILSTYFNPNNIKVTNGIITDYIKNELGYTEMFKENIKNNIIKYKNSDKIDKRIDDRNHALDAIVIAMVNQKVIHRINNMNKIYNLNDESLSNFIKKIANEFFNTQNHIDIVKTTIDKCMVRRKKSNLPFFIKKVKDKCGDIHKINCLRTPLHNETLYGKNWKEDDSYTRYISIEDFILDYKKLSSDIEKLKNNIDSGKSKNIEEDTNLLNKSIKKLNDFFDKIVDPYTADLFKKYGNTSDAIKKAIECEGKIRGIKKIKIKCKNNKLTKLSGNRNVDLANNHMIIIYKKNNNITHECISLYDYCNKKHKEVFINNNDNIINVFKINDYFVIDYTKEELQNMINNNNYDFLNKTFFINQLASDRLYFKPYYTTNEYFKSGKGVNKFYKEHNNKIVKIKINNYGKIYL